MFLKMMRFKAKKNPEGGRDFFNQINSSFFRSEIIRCKNEVDISFLVFAAEESVLPFGITFLWFSWLVCVSPAIILFSLSVFTPYSYCKLIINTTKIPSVFSRYFIWGFYWFVIMKIFMPDYWSCNGLVNNKKCIFKSLYKELNKEDPENLKSRD